MRLFSQLLLPLASLALVLLPIAPGAQAAPVVKSTHGDWQIQCEQPPGAPAELCGLVQNVAAMDRPNVELRITIVRTADGSAHILRVVAPLGVLLTAGLGLKIDGNEIGVADFVRCLPSGCYVELVMEDTLITQMKQGTDALFVIFQTPEEGIGIPVSLNGFGAGFDALN